MDKEFYELKTDVIKALANSTRLMIIDCLRNGEKSVSELVDILGEEQSNVSKCLGVLKSRGLVEDRKVGLNVFYCLKCRCLDNFFNCIDEVISESIREKQELLK